MQTGENEQALRKIIDFTRFLSIGVLLVHFYLCCYPAFIQFKLTTPIVDRILQPLAGMVIFKTLWAAKASALLLLLASLAGSKGKKDEKLRLSGDSDECDHSIPAQADHPFRAKLTSAFRGKLTTPNA